MTDFFEKMTEDYAQKHFPDGSVFASALKTVKRRGIGGFIFFGLFLAASLYGYFVMPVLIVTVIKL